MAFHKITEVQELSPIASACPRGSQQQLQAYVNSYPEVITQAVLKVLPDEFQKPGVNLQWVSPLSNEVYREYRDADFLRRLGLGHLAPQLAAFWPGRGPCWDALAMTQGGGLPAAKVLVEAKSHIPEIYSGGCKAGVHSRARITAAVREAQQWCGANAGADWLGTVYQSGNRIAHLYLLSEKLKVPTWLVNLYFTGDPIAPTSRDEWTKEIVHVKKQLGLTQPVRNMVEVFLPALHRE